MEGILAIIASVLVAFFSSSWVGEIIKGKHNNKDVANKLNDMAKLMETNDQNLNNRITTLEKNLSKLEYKVEKNDAETRRQRIIRLSRESSNRVLEEEELDTVVEDIKVYESFCQKHDEFENGKATRSINNLRFIDRKRREGTKEASLS